MPLSLLPPHPRILFSAPLVAPVSAGLGCPVLWAWAEGSRLDLEPEGLRESFLPCLHLSSSLPGVSPGVTSPHPTPRAQPHQACPNPELAGPPGPTSVGRISPELQASHSGVLLHLIPRKFLLPDFMPHWLCHSRPSRLLGVGCPGIRGSAAASPVPHLTLLGFWLSGLLSLELPGPTDGPGPQQNTEDSGCLWAKPPAGPEKGGSHQFQELGRPRLAVGGRGITLWLGCCPAAKGETYVGHASPAICGPRDDPQQDQGPP